MKLFGSPSPSAPVASPQQALLGVWIKCTRVFIKSLVDKNLLESYAAKGSTELTPEGASALGLVKQFLASQQINVSEMEALREAIPLFPRERLLKLAALYMQNKTGFAEAQSWALPEEINLVMTKAQAAEARRMTPITGGIPTQIQPPITQIQPPAPVAQPQPQEVWGGIDGPLFEEAETRIVPSTAGGAVEHDPKGSAIAEVDHLAPVERMGYLIEEAYQRNGMNISFVSPASEGMRCDRFVFKKPVDMNFSLPESKKEVVLSHAGIDPDIDAIFRPLAGNKFEIQIPRPQEQWQKALLLQHVSDDRGLIILQDTRARDRVEAFIKHCHKVSPRKAHELKVPFAIDLDGNLVSADLYASCLIVGASRSGKSVGMKALTAGAMLQYPHELLKFSAILDMKGGITFEKFNGLKWLERPVLVNPRHMDTDSLDEFRGRMTALFEELRDEKNSREDLIKSVGLDDIVEFNRAFPDSPIAWSPILIDEVAMFSRIMQEPGEIMLFEILSQWAAYGMPLVCGTQYASQKRGLSPDMRVNFNSIIAFRCSDGCAKLAFGDDDSRYVKTATKLMGKGDCLIKQAGSYYRAQGLFIENDHLNPLISGLKAIGSVNKWDLN